MLIAGLGTASSNCWAWTALKHITLRLPKFCKAIGVLRSISSAMEAEDAGTSARIAAAMLKEECSRTQEDDRAAQNASSSNDRKISATLPDALPAQELTFARQRHQHELDARISRIANQAANRA
jgi:hypothetical protein